MLSAALAAAALPVAAAQLATVGLWANRLGRPAAS